jgi:hypothetical protein
MFVARPRRMARVSPLAVVGLLSGFSGLSVIACHSSSDECTDVAIERPMTYEASVPASIDIASMTLETCFGAVCDTSRVAASENPNVSGLLCQDVDGHTPNFPTTCTFLASARTLSLSTNTVYGGHAGSDPLVLTAVTPAGARTELLRGTVTYTDTTDEAARGACTQAWQGSFTKT